MPASAKRYCSRKTSNTYHNALTVMTQESLSIVQRRTATVFWSTNIWAFAIVPPIDLPSNYDSQRHGRVGYLGFVVECRKGFSLRIQNKPKSSDQQSWTLIQDSENRGWLTLSVWPSKTFESLRGWEQDFHWANLCDLNKERTAGMV
jgi:hypothetical protein